MINLFKPCEASYKQVVVLLIDSLQFKRNFSWLYGEILANIGCFNANNFALLLVAKNEQIHVFLQG